MATMKKPLMLNETGEAIKAAIENISLLTLEKNSKLTDTTYTLTRSGNTLTFTGSDGSVENITLPVSSDGTTTSDPITYNFKRVGDDLVITPSEGGAVTISLGTEVSKVNGHSVEKDVPADAAFTDSDTTYTLTISGTTLTLSSSDGSTQSIVLPEGGMTKETFSHYDSDAVITDLNNIPVNTAGHTTESDGRPHGRQP